MASNATLCGIVQLQAARSAQAWFSDGSGVRGSVTLMQDNAAAPALVRFSLQGLGAAFSSCTVQQAPGQPLQPQACAALPAFSPSSYPSAGQLSARLTSLDGLSSLQATFEDPSLTLFGPNSIAGRAIVLAGARVLCSNLQLLPSASQAYAAVGTLVFTQPAPDESVLVQGSFQASSYPLNLTVTPSVSPPVGPTTIVQQCPDSSVAQALLDASGRDFVSLLSSFSLSSSSNNSLLGRAVTAWSNGSCVATCVVQHPGLLTAVARWDQYPGLVVYLQQTVANPFSETTIIVDNTTAVSSQSLSWAVCAGPTSFSSPLALPVPAGLTVVCGNAPCLVGDLSSKFCSLYLNTASTLLFYDLFLPLTGPSSVVGLPLVLGGLVSQPLTLLPSRTAWAALGGGASGYVSITQPHPWASAVLSTYALAGPVDVRIVAAQSTFSQPCPTQPIFQPSSASLGAAAGLISSRLGPLAPAPLLDDPLVTLFGRNSVAGLALLAQPVAAPLSCAPLQYVTPVRTLTASFRGGPSLPSGTVLFTRLVDSPLLDAIVHISLLYADGAANTKVAVPGLRWTLWYMF